MIDGVHFADHLLVVGLGIGLDGAKHTLALVEGSTENATPVGDLFVSLRQRGLDTPARRCLSSTVSRRSARQSKTCLTTQ